MRNLPKTIFRCLNLVGMSRFPSKNFCVDFLTSMLAFLLNIFLCKLQYVSRIMKKNTSTKYCREFLPSDDSCWSFKAQKEVYSFWWIIRHMLDSNTSFLASQTANSKLKWNSQQLLSINNLMLMTRNSHTSHFPVLHFVHVNNTRLLLDDNARQRQTNKNNIAIQLTEKFRIFSNLKIK
jgi:hypothetical protein